MALPPSPRYQIQWYMPSYPSWTSLKFDVVLTFPLAGETSLLLGSSDTWSPASLVLPPILNLQTWGSVLHVLASLPVLTPRVMTSHLVSRLWVLSLQPMRIFHCHHHSDVSQTPQTNSQDWILDFPPQALPSPSLPFCSKWPKALRHLWLLFLSNPYPIQQQIWLALENKFRTWHLVTNSTTTWFSHITSCFKWSPN